MMAVASGADRCVAITLCSRLNEAGLRTVPILPNRSPSHDTVGSFENGVFMWLLADGSERLPPLPRRNRRVSAFRPRRVRQKRPACCRSRHRRTGSEWRLRHPVHPGRPQVYSTTCSAGCVDLPSPTVPKFPVGCSKPQCFSVGGTAARLQPARRQAPDAYSAPISWRTAARAASTSSPRARARRTACSSASRAESTACRD